MKPNLMRLVLGLVAVVLIDLLFYPNIVATFLSQVSDMDSFFVWMVATEFVFLFFATAVGGYIARANFVVPATIYAGADFMYGVYQGVRLGGQPGELDFSSAPFVALSLVAVLAVAAIGSIVGMKVFDRINRQGLATR